MGRLRVSVSIRYHGAVLGRIHRPLKRVVYTAARRAGLFRLARRRAAGRLRILCFHGVHDGDLAEFRPGLFHRPETFAERLDLIVRSGFPVLPLGEAAKRLRQDRLPEAAVVLTIDDGFQGLLEHAIPQLEARDLPATVYVTSYYCDQRLPIFNLALQYVLWRTEARRVDLDGLAPGIPGGPAGPRSLVGEAALTRLAEELTAWGEEALDAEARNELARSLSVRLGVDFEALERSRALHLLEPQQIEELSSRGFDVQLHTHRHRLPVDEVEARREVMDNRLYLEPLVGERLVHLCYPSGQWSEQHLPWLEALDIESATTCEPGLASAEHHPLALPRFLDAENVHLIEVEAELWGFGEWMRSLKRRGRRSSTLPGSEAPPPEGEAPPPEGVSP